MWLQLPNGGIVDLRGGAITPAPKSDEIFVTKNISVGIPSEQQPLILAQIFRWLTSTLAANGELVGMVWYVESNGQHYVKSVTLSFPPG